MSIKSFIARRPIIATLIITALYLVLQGVVSVSTSFFSRTLMVRLFAVEIAGALFVAVLLTGLRWWREAGFTPPVQWRDLQLYLFPAALLGCASLALIVVRPTVTPLQVISTAVLALLIGFAEEGLFRGILLRILMPGGALRAALLSSLLFGFIHLVNLNSGFDPTYVVFQMAAAFALALMYAALRIRTGMIWFVILLHAWQDFASILARGEIIVTQTYPPEMLTAALGLGAVYAIYALYLLRPGRVPRLQTLEPVQ